MTAYDLVVIDSGKVRTGNGQNELLVKFSYFIDKRSEAESMMRHALCGPTMQARVGKNCRLSHGDTQSKKLEDKTFPATGQLLSLYGVCVSYATQGGLS